jgi:hypothetical protein
MNTLDVSDAPKFGRTQGLTRCLMILHNLRSEDDPVIVEIGCVRGDQHPDMVGDGWSTLAFGWYCKKYGGQLYTIDRDEKAIKICEKLAADYSDNIVYICADSIEGLGQVGDFIDLLYLDGHAKPQYSHSEYMAIRCQLSDNAIILIDDADIKGTLVIPQLIKDGWNNLGRIGPQHLFVGKQQK